MIPKEGDYCKYNFVILEEYNGKILPCENCKIRCIHSKNKKDNDYLIKKNNYGYYRKPFN